MTIVCAHCDRRIYFEPAICKWVTDRYNWKCLNDPAFPVRAHTPRKPTEKKKEQSNG